MSMPTEHRPPYKGLVPYTERDAQFFWPRIGD